MIPIFFNFLAIVLLILTAVKINSQKASIYFRHTCYQHLVRRPTH